MKVLIIGSGGREHAIAWKISQNKSVDTIYCAPGNGGTENEDKCINVDIEGIENIACFAEKNKIDLTVVGPEVPLVEGIYDEFKKRNLRIFGPSKKASMLEGSKSYSKDFMKKYGVRTAEYEVFYDKDSALSYLKECSYPIVIKADGLAAGKGVVIAENFEEAENTVKAFMVDDVFKGSGKKVVIEEFLEGVEASILSICDGETIIPFISAKDHKNIFEGNKGPNTGGMGAVSPNPYCTKEVLEDFRENIMIPTLNGIKKEKLDYTGIIFFGLMITKKGVYLLEYNVRMGDPETQAVLPLMETDLVELMEAAIDKRLSSTHIAWKKKKACSVVAASSGYPKKYNTGFEITGCSDVKNKIFAAGAEFKNGKLLTSGGRVLSVTAIGDTMEDARKKAYEDIEKIKFNGIYYRKDIGVAK